MRSARYASAASDFGRAYVTRAGDSDFSVSTRPGFRRLRKSRYGNCSGYRPERRQRRNRAKLFRIPDAGVQTLQHECKSDTAGKAEQKAELDVPGHIRC